MTEDGWVIDTIIDDDDDEDNMRWRLLRVLVAVRRSAPLCDDERQAENMMLLLRFGADLVDLFFVFVFPSKSFGPMSGY